MSEHASFRCYGERDDRKGAVQQRVSWHQWLLVCMAVAFTVCSPLRSEAVNGEPVGAEGLFRTGACSTDFTISCDDRSQAGVVSCHMRRPAVAPALAKDEGLAINACVDGRITTATAQSLETDVAIRATDFGEFVCGKESDGSDFCIVCDTFKDPEASIGASHCVKIVNNEELLEPSTCGAFSVSKDETGLCLSATQDLKHFFSDPHLGFMIGFNGSDAGDPEGKDLLICGSRSWQCIDRTSEFALAAGQVQQQQTHALIDTPCCMRLASGAYYCSTKLTTSTTCR